MEEKDVEGKDIILKKEMVYGGVLRIKGIKKENMIKIMLIEWKRILLKLERKIIEEEKRNGG